MNFVSNSSFASNDGVFRENGVMVCATMSRRKQGPGKSLPKATSGAEGVRLNLKRFHLYPLRLRQPVQRR